MIYKKGINLKAHNIKITEKAIDYLDSHREKIQAVDDICSRINMLYNDCPVYVTYDNDEMLQEIYIGIVANKIDFDESMKLLDKLDEFLISKKEYMEGIIVDLEFTE